MDKDSEISLYNKMVGFVKGLNETGDANGGSLVLIEKDGSLVAIGNQFNSINPERLGRVIHNLFLKLYGQKFIDTFMASMIIASNEINNAKTADPAINVDVQKKIVAPAYPFQNVSKTVH